MISVPLCYFSTGVILDAEHAVPLSKLEADLIKRYASQNFSDQVQAHAHMQAHCMRLEKSEIITL